MPTFHHRWVVAALASPIRLSGNGVEAASSGIESALAHMMARPG